MIDSDLSMKMQISQLSRTCYLHLRNISRIRSCLTTEAAKLLSLSLVMSRLDYCNSLLINSPTLLINKLQKVQNVAARITSQSPKADYIKPVLKDLHWLPIRERILFNVLCFAYQCITELHLSTCQTFSLQMPPAYVFVQRVTDI